MDLLVHGIILAASLGVVWYFAGLVVEAVTRLAQRFCITGFLTAFFLLGFLTSISEFSVAVNALATGLPAVSAGNVIGASFVLLLFIVPLLAIAGQGVVLNRAVSHGTLFALLTTAALPVVLAIDGNVTRTEGALALFFYFAVAYALYLRRTRINACEPPEIPASAGHTLLAEIGRVVVGTIAVFIGAYFLVEQAVYFAAAAGVAPAVIGLLILSIGTNVPELVIAIRALMRERTDIAFGNYLGSAAMNTFIFGVLAVTAGTFSLNIPRPELIAAVFVAGLGSLYLFSRTGTGLSKREGFVLLLFYAAFLALEVLVIGG